MDLERLRTLRSRARNLRSTLIDDFSGFRAADNVTFVWEPDTADLDVSAATTCTGLMALAATKSLSQYYAPKDATASARSAFNRVMQADWNSSGLPQDNPFTTILAIRTAGMLRVAGVVDAQDVLAIKREVGTVWNGKTLGEIARAMIDGFPAIIEIQGYPPAAAVAYWLIDGMTNLEIELPAASLATVAEFARDRLVREISLASANNDALMDPVAMAMSAALAWRLTGSRKPLHASTVRQKLPTNVEIDHAVAAFLAKQLPGGLWPKYFPLFHFPESMAGANYCWSFEVLEALLLELSGAATGPALGVLLSALEKGITWCEQNRLIFEPEGRRKRTGWNSGSNIMWLQAGIPELWATGVVHMFAHQVEALLSQLIRRGVERKYRAQTFAVPDDGKWLSILDFDLKLVGEKGKTSVKKEIEDRMIKPIASGRRPVAKSALLFGPPGTSKTSLVKAVAQRTGWSYVELSPTDFLNDGLPNIYTKANEIFNDLGDLRNAVILFDEMDALARTREDDGGEHPLDVTQQFLTTSMLPKLARLHDQDDVVFFMATNFQSRFDAAIKRPGRFDLLLLLGPPSWSRKLDGIAAFWRSDDASRLELTKMLHKWVPPRSTTAKQLDHFTFGEMAAFFESVISDAKQVDRNLLRALKRIGQKRFAVKVASWHHEYIALSPRVGRGPVRARDNELARYRGDMKVSRRQ